MELEGDGPAPRHFTAPDTSAVQSIHVTPENVVGLAVMIRECVDLLERDLPHLDTDLRLRAPWLDDPVSRWAFGEFNLYFTAFQTIVEAQHELHKAVRDALVTTAQRYGLTEELIAAGFTKLALRK